MSTRWLRRLTTRHTQGFISNFARQSSVAVVALSTERHSNETRRAQRSGWSGRAPCPRPTMTGRPSVHAVFAGRQIAHLFFRGRLWCTKNSSVSEREMSTVQVMPHPGCLARHHPVHVHRGHDILDLGMPDRVHDVALLHRFPEQNGPHSILRRPSWCRDERHRRSRPDEPGCGKCERGGSVGSAVRVIAPVGSRIVACFPPPVGDPYQNRSYLSAPEQECTECGRARSISRSPDRTRPSPRSICTSSPTPRRDLGPAVTTTLFAVLDVASGKVIGSLHRRHRADEFKKFLMALDKQTPPGLICIWCLTTTPPTRRRPRQPVQGPAHARPPPGRPYRRVPVPHRRLAVGQGRHPRRLRVSTTSAPAPPAFPPPSGSR